MRRATCAVALGAVCSVAIPVSAAPLVTSDSDCPSAAEVTNRLAGLWSGDNPVSATAHVRVEAGRMAVDLASESEPATSRILPAEPDCESRAQAAALVIAAWLDSMPADPLGRVESVAVLSVAPASLRAPTAEKPLPAQPRFSLGVAALASVDARGAGAVLSGEAAWARLAGRFGLASGLSVPLPREMGVGQGTARWWRPVLALAVRAPLTQGAWVVDGGIGPAFGLLVVAGSGYHPDNTDVAVSWGATAGLRLAHRSSKWAYWAELRTVLWPAAQNIRSDVEGSNTPKLAALPRIEAQLGLGFSFGLF
ncbi:MAG: hypothetical protein WBP56_17795 [Polyangia bacterium]